MKTVFCFIRHVLECDGQKYGKECNENCGQCRKGEQCNHIDGRCPNGCALGVFGDKCINATKGKNKK